jgi:hypothetical protein
MSLIMSYEDVKPQVGEAMIMSLEELDAILNRRVDNESSIFPGRLTREDFQMLQRIYDARLAGTFDYGALRPIKDEEFVEYVDEPEVKIEAVDDSEVKVEAVDDADVKVEPLED